MEEEKVKDRIFWLSDSPMLTTGFATISWNVLNTLADKYECHFQAAHNYAGQTLPPGLTFKDGTKLNFHIHGCGMQPYCMDILTKKIRQIRPKVFGILLDTFMLMNPNNWFLNLDTAPAKTLFYFPTDGGGGLPQNCEWALRRVDLPIAMSRFGQKQVKKAHGIDSLYIPHACDTSIFNPMTFEEKEKVKAELGLKGKFVVGCFLKNTPILMSDYSEKSIQDIIVGDSVITHNGITQKVSDIMRREYSGDLYSMQITGISEKVEATEEHPILSIKRKDIFCKFPSRKKRRAVCRGKKYNSCRNCDIYKKPLIPKWNKIKNLEVGDFTAFPIPKEEVDMEYLDMNKFFDIPKINKYTKRNIPPIIKLTPEFLKILGWFLAEGNFSKSQNSLNGIVFSLNINEIEKSEFIMDTIEKHFGIRPSKYIRNDKSGITIKVYNKLMAHLFKFLCGEYCDKKEMHGLLMKLSPHKQLCILEGFCEGDGCVRKNSHCDTERTVMVSTSEKLIRQLFIICLRNRIIANINQRKIYGITRKDAWNLTIHQNSNWKPSFFVNGWLLRPILNIEKKSVDETVYNFEVECDNSYIVNGIAVHNCVARNQGRKMLDREVKAFKLFCKDKPDAVLYMHADPFDPAAPFDIVELVKRLKLENRVLWTGTTFGDSFTYKRMRDVYNIMDIFFLSTSGEGFGIPIIEASACGVPTVVTDYTTTQELCVEDGKCGEPVKLVGDIQPPVDHITEEIVDGTVIGNFLVERGIMSIYDAAEKLNKLYYDEKLRRTYGEVGIKKVREFYSWDKVKPLWHNAIERLL